MHLKQFYTVTFIKEQESGKSDWPEGVLMAKGIGLQNLVYGILGLMEIVLRHGTISLSQDDISLTVFMNPQQKRAKMFIIHFK